jgi:hypothetical protein
MENCMNKWSESLDKVFGYNYLLILLYLRSPQARLDYSGYCGLPFEKINVILKAYRK